MHRGLFLPEFPSRSTLIPPSGGIRSLLSSLFLFFEEKTGPLRTKKPPWKKNPAEKAALFGDDVKVF